MLTGADLTGADLRGSDVRRADFRDASLVGADLSQLRGARRAVFSGATYDDSTVLDPAIDTRDMVYLPEPGANALLAAGVAALLACRRHRERRA